MDRTLCQTLRVVSLFIPLVFLSACSEKDDVQVIRQLMTKGAVLAEKKQVADLMAFTTEGFSADPGGLDARSVKGILLRAFMHYGKFKLHYPIPSVELADDGNSAVATVHLLIVRQNQTIPGLKDLYDDPERWIETVGEKADVYKLKLSLAKEGGDWLVGKAGMQAFKGTGF